MKFDIYYSKALAESSRKIAVDRSRVHTYISRANLSQFRGKTYDTTIDEESRQVIESVEEVKAVSYTHLWLTSEYGNPSSLYRAGRKAKEALECARAMIARTINAEPDEIFFTSGGTEADNWAIDMIGTHGDIITSSIEHHAILNAAHNRFERDVKALKLMTDCHGHIVPPNESETRSLILQNKPVMCSFMFVNNEIGTVQDLRKLFKAFNGYGLIYHTDAVQAVGHIPVCLLYTSHS